MSRAIVRNGPAYFANVPVKRGDDVSLLWELFESFAGVDGDTTTVALDLTGRTYTSSIATTQGGTVISAAAPTVTTPTPSNGQIVWALTDTQTDALTARTYVFDIIENAGTASERTIIEGTLSVSGRATP